MYYRILAGVNVDDLLTDWSKFCHAHDMVFGAPMSDGTHHILVTSEGRECNVHIDHPNGSNSLETLENYLNDYIRRHQELHIDIIETEEILRNRSLHEDDTIGFIITE